MRMPKTAKTSAKRASRDAKALKASLGWREWASLPELGIEQIKVKVDTGARTSALHAFNIYPFHSDGQDWVRFDIHPVQRDDAIEQSCTAPARDYRWVTNSGGKREKRFVIETPIQLGGREWPIEVTLTDRDQMGFRMLIGRSAIIGEFVVDPAKSYCSKPTKRTTAKKPHRRPKAAAKPITEEE